jgi:uncharacterized protein
MAEPWGGFSCAAHCCPPFPAVSSVDISERMAVSCRHQPGLSASTRHRAHRILPILRPALSIEDRANRRKALWSTAGNAWMAKDLLMVTLRVPLFHTVPMQTHGFRQAIVDYIRANALPPDKFSHQPRLFALACSLAGGEPFDEAVLFAAVWMHDLGVFVGHRPEDPAQLAAWDHIAYAERTVPRLLGSFGFPKGKIPAVLEAIRSHLPSGRPWTFEGKLMRDADILEQLGAVGMLRVISKTGRDTRFVRFGDALRVLRRNLEELPGQLQLASARRAAEPRLQVLREFLAAAEAETGGVEW